MLTKRTKRFFIVSIIILTTVLLIFSAFGEYVGGGYFKLDPDPQYIPTAASLIEKPEPLLGLITSVNPPPGSTLTGNELVCVGMKVSESDRNGFASWSSILLNGQKISRRDMAVGSYGDLADASHATLEFCFTPMLHSGYHYFELRAASTISAFFNPDAGDIYRWAYFVE